MSNIRTILRNYEASFYAQGKSSTKCRLTVCIGASFLSFGILLDTRRLKEGICTIVCHCGMELSHFAVDGTQSYLFLKCERLQKEVGFSKKF